jgi:hypothetical protein
MSISHWDPTFLGVFTKLQKATLSYLSVCLLPACMEKYGSQCAEFQGVWYLWIFQKSVEKIEV